ncbi:MAG TPA: hypothetical protein VK191_13360 [Symbiobacteriaceae bacterium]|nr:hypothetical protein [Symbiobacteriaceae bacterium]
MVVKKKAKMGEMRYRSTGFTVYDATRRGLNFMEWTTQGLCDLGTALQNCLKRHAVVTNWEKRTGDQTCLLSELELLPVRVWVETEPHEIKSGFVNEHGLPLDQERALSLPKMRVARLDDMADTSVQVGRALRAHLSSPDGPPLRLELWYGLNEMGACILHVVDPLRCDLGLQDAADLITRLGGL